MVIYSWTCCSSSPGILAYLVVPFGQTLIIADLRIGIFFWIAISSIAPIGLLMSGYGSNNKYSFLGGLRAAAQSISYELPLAICVLSVCLLADSHSTVDIVESQSSWGILTWNIWRQPIGFVAFLIAALAECERLPFDLPEAEEELVAGYQTEYTGMKFVFVLCWVLCEFTGVWLFCDGLIFRWLAYSFFNPGTSSGKSSISSHRCVYWDYMDLAQNILIFVCSYSDALDSSSCTY